MRRVLKSKNNIFVSIFALVIVLSISTFLCVDTYGSGTAKNVYANKSYAYNNAISAPEFSGKPAIELNGNIPNFNDKQKLKTNSFENYMPLDNLGRCRVAYANIGRDLMPLKERGEIGQVKPSGWHTVKYNDVIEGNYLYNRCHLIGYQLTGENANTKNLITGTRFMNVDGMLPYENEVANYVRRTGNHVLYRVTPIFEEDNLVANGVVMEAWSVEDNGKGVCFNVFCYNVQPGIDIDYASGESTQNKEYQIPKSSEYESVKTKEVSNSAKIKSNETTSTHASNEQTETCSYIGNKNTHKFHKPDCTSVGDMAEHNKYEYTGPRQGIIDQGYIPCKRCKP